METVLRSGIPAVALPLIGRRDELAAARRLLAGSRLVTVVGPGGVGKTHFAAELASSLERSFADGVCYVSLTTARDPDEVEEVLAAAVGLEDAPVDVLCSAIAGARLLLVIDQCEHVVGAVAAMIMRILRSGDGVRILATSRISLAVGAESLFALGPLAVPAPDAGEEQVRAAPAVQLFIDRATRVSPRFDPSDHWLDVKEICFRLDGLPLAIELAAARLRALSTASLLSRLREPFRLLRGGGVTETDRNRTLHSSIAWSFDLCSTTERELWTRLSVFVDGFSLDAAEAVAVDGGIEEHEALDVVQSLVEKSVISVEHLRGDEWFSMLSSIREFGREKLGESDHSAGLAHLGWCRAFVQQAEEEWFGADHELWNARAARELPNIRAALQFALDVRGDGVAALGLVMPLWRGLWSPRGHLGELLGWIRRILDALPSDSDRWLEVRVWYLHVASLIHGPQSTTSDFEQILARLGDERFALLRTVVEISLADTRPPSEDTIMLFERLIDGGVGARNPLLQSRLQIRLALLYDRFGPAEAAEQLVDLILERSRVGGERVDRAYLLVGLALNRIDDDDLDAAAAHLRAVFLFRPNAVPFPMIAQAVTVSAVVHARRGRMGAASTLFGVAEGLAARFTTAPQAFSAVEELARPYLDRADPALRNDGRALELGAALRLAADDVVREHPRAAHESTSPPRESAVLPGLTRRQSEVAMLVAQGLTDRQIAERLVIAQRTAEGHVQSILVALGFSSRQQITALILSGPRTSS